MARSTHIRNYNNLSGGVITDVNLLSAAPDNAVKDALNFEFSLTAGASRRKALDLESGISGSDYVNLDSSFGLGVTKHQVFTFKKALDQLDSPVHDIVFSTFEGEGIVYELGNDQQLADAVLDASITAGTIPGSGGGGWEDIAWSPELGLFVTVAATTPSANNVIISTDGLNWNRPLATNNNFRFDAVVWSPELGVFCAASQYANMVSSDGNHWEVGTPLSGMGTVALTWAPELALFVAVGSTGTCKTSADGLTWTTRTIGARNWTAVTWSSSKGLLVAVANANTGTGNLVNTSPDGITWTARATPATDRDWTTVCWSEGLGKYFATGLYLSQVMSSSDGITWSEASPASFGGGSDIEWLAALSLLVSTSVFGVWTSPDGTTWTQQRYTPSLQSSPGRFAWSEDFPRIVGFTGFSPSPIITSEDAVTWDTSSYTTSLNDEYQDWTVVQGLPMGAVGRPELSFLYNTDSTYVSAVTTGLGKEASVRDFQGVRDTLATDERPLSMSFTVGSVTGTFTQGEDILIGTVNRRYRIVKTITATNWTVDKSLILGDTTAFDGGDLTSLVGYSVTGISSGATATITAQAGTGLSDAHRYNLINQGWTQIHMDTYVDSTTYWPSNAQTWYSGRDSNNDFDPTELDKVAFGNSEAPKGHIILNPFKEWRHTKVPGVWSGAVPGVTYSRGFTTIAAFGSRVALAGASIGGVENNVYISPVLFSKLINSNNAEVGDLDFTELFKFHQRNDPTADLQNELLPDDGVVIPITGAGRIYKLVEMHNALLVIASNGVWSISGLDLQSGFTTDAFTVYRIKGAPGCTNVNTIVDTKDTIYYWSNDGIYGITVDGDSLVAANATVNRIGKIYSGITTDARAAAISYHDEENHKIYWAYNGQSTVTYPEFRNKLLVLDLVTKAWYPLKTPEKLTDSQGHLSTYYMSINGFTQDPAFPNADGTVPLKLLITETNGTTWNHAVMEFNNSGASNFDDFEKWRLDVHTDSDAGVHEDAYIETHPDSLGDNTRLKQPLWVFTYMTKTETGFVDIGGGALEAVGQSGLSMKNKWDWHDSAEGGRWGNAREIYRHKRPYIPVDASDTYDTGESVIQTKNKVYGEGMALGLRFDAQDNKDAVLLGYAIPYTVAGAP